ncbi:MAG: hypothetical protein ACREOG_01835 [Gemmatimonadaceae bacterium]
MMRVYGTAALGVLLTVATATDADAQMVVRSSGSRTGAVSAPTQNVRPSTLPTMRFGSMPRSDFDRFDGMGRWPRRHSGPRYFTPGFSHRSFGFLGVPYVTETVVAYAVPYYVPVPAPVQTWPAPSPRTPPRVYDPTKSKMLTIGGGADGGGGVMRIESVSDSVVRLTWLGNPRPIREVRVLLADSTQRTLRSALVDRETPSALLRVADLATRVAYVGLTITFADGAIETTLVPYPMETDRKPEPPAQNRN